MLNQPRRLEVFPDFVDCLGDSSSSLPIPEYWGLVLGGPQNLRAQVILDSSPSNEVWGGLPLPRQLVLKSATVAPRT
jgi:hypothetical protein